jgi:hypothetical protein
MILGTWLTVAVLGPGATLVMLWFLLDLRRRAKDGGDP